MAMLTAATADIALADPVRAARLRRRAARSHSGCVAVAAARGPIADERDFVRAARVWHAAVHRGPRLPTAQHEQGTQRTEAQNRVDGARPSHC